jgi:drug/metabolite transporter (DMT)-like permease
VVDNALRDIFRFRRRAAQPVWFGFALLCLLTGSTWLPAQAFATTWPSSLKLWVHDLLAGVILLTAAWAMRSGLRWRTLLETFAWGFVLFALTQTISDAAGSRVHGSTELLVLGLVPFFTVFFEAQSEGGEMRLLVPAVAGLGGLALVAQFSWPGSAAGVGWLAGLVCASGLVSLAGIRLRVVMRGAAVLPCAASGSLGAATGSFAVWALLLRQPVPWDWPSFAIEAGWAVGIDLPLILLAFWLLGRMRPVSFASRFLLVPLVTLLGSMAVLRPSVEWTTWVGLALVAGASWALLTDRGEPSASLRSFS